MPHWYIGGKKYYDKRNFLIDAQNTTDEYGFYISDEFHNHQWNIEQCVSWKELLKNKCLNLREHSNYLRLWYTGGADSQTILNAFINNNIHLDEIIIAYSWDPKRVEHNNYEQILVAEKFLKENTHTLRKTKITHFQINNSNMIPYINDVETGWLSMHNNLPHLMVTPFHLEKWLMRDTDRDILDISGDTKHCISVDNYGFYSQVPDIIVNGVYEPECNNLCHFYLDPIIWQKQCDLVFSWAKKTGVSEIINPKFRTNLNYITDRINRDNLPFEFTFSKSPSGIKWNFWRHAGFSRNQYRKKLLGIGLTQIQADVFVDYPCSKDKSLINRLYNENNKELLNCWLNAINHAEEFAEKNIKDRANWYNNSDTVIEGTKGIVTQKYYFEKFDKEKLNFYKNLFCTNDLSNI